MLLTLKRMVPTVGRFVSDLDKLETPDGWIALDTETTGLDPWGTMGVDRVTHPARPFCVSLCNADGTTYYERWPVDPQTRRVLCRPSKGLIRVLADPSIEKIGFNTNFDIRMLRMSGIEVNGELHDVVLMAHVLDPDAFDKRLKPLCKKFLDMEVDDEKDVEDAVKTMRAKVRVARLRARTAGLVVLSDEDRAMSHWSVYEPPYAEWEEIKSADKDTNVKADMFLVPQEEAVEKYARKDALRTAMLYEFCRKALDENLVGPSGWDSYRMELELMPVVAAMENRGIRVDRDRNLAITSYYQEVMHEHKAKIAEHAGASFDPGSWKQKQRYFFMDHDYVPLKYSEKKDKRAKLKKQPSCAWCKGRGCKVCQHTGRSPVCNGDFLASIGVGKNGDTLVPKDPVAWHMLHFGAARSMLTFCSAYEKFAVVENGNHILHPNYKQAGPVTNRFSAERPNMQNASSDESGKKKVDIPYRSREPFIPRDGHVMYVPDYAQIEIWILFLRSMDEALGEILLSGGDTHGKVAAMVVPGSFDLDDAIEDKNKDPRELSPKRLANLKAYVRTRKKAKNTQFCKVYGGGPPKISETAGCPLGEAEEFVHKYEETFSGVSAFMRERVRSARKLGYVENAFGRRYPIDFDRAYVATNYDIQGTAADLIKRSMIRVGKLCEETYTDRMFLELTIHDELLLDVHNSIDSKDTMVAVAREMQADYKLLKCPKPFPVGMKIARERWSECQEIKL